MPTMTVFFDQPFWVAVLETRDDDGTVRAIRHVFGGEPTNPELYEFLLRHGTALLRRMDVAVPGDDAEAALREDRGQRKEDARRGRRERREAEADERFAKRRAKARAKHRGR
jgi:hypothetical protein